jgi:hypothetical protein
MPTPLDFEQISAERAARAQRMGLEQNKKAAGVDAERPFSTLPIQEPEPVLGNFTDVEPTRFNQVGVAAPNDPGVTEDKELPSFGRGLVGAFKDVREGTVKNVPAILRPLAFPLVKAGQGFLAATEWSGNVATTGMPHIVEPIQRVLPGQQKFERLVDEQVQKGIPRSKALRKAWEDHHGTWELPFKIPFATTAFTPEGSITLDFQDIIEVGLDPIELALLFGTGGLGSGAGIAAGITGKQTVGAGLKTAVAQSVGVRGGRNIASRSAGAGRFAASEARTGAAGTRQAISDLPTPGEIVSRGTSAVGTGIQNVMHPRQAAREGLEERVDNIRHFDEPETLAPGLLPDEDLIDNVSTKDWRFENMLNKLPEMIRGKETSKRYQLASGLGRQTFDRMVKLADPSAVVGDNEVARASVIREVSIARMSQQIGVGLSYVDRAIFDHVFNVDQFGRSRVKNIQLTEKGKKLFENAGIADAGADGFMMGDILELTLKDVMVQVRKNGRFTSDFAPSTNLESIFKGLTADQRLALDRFHKFTVDWLELAKKEGAIEVADGKLVGFRFGDEATQEFGDVDQMFRYSHREVISKEILKDGEETQLMMQRPRGEGMGTSRTAFDKSRQYDTMEEAAREGTLYAHPMEAMESMAITIAQLIGDKRAMNHLKRNNIVVTKAEAFERLFPRMLEDISLTTKAQKAALANVNRLKKKVTRREGAQVYVTGSKSKALSTIRDYERRAREDVVATNAAQRQMLKTVRAQLGLMDKDEAYSAALKTGDKKKIQEARGQRTSARKSYAVNKARFTDRMEAVGTAGKRVVASAKRMNTQKNRVQAWKQEYIGVTDDLTVALKELELVTTTLDNLKQVQSRRMKEIVQKRDIQLKAFGETGDALKNNQQDIVHFQNGPLANSFAFESHAKELKATFGDNGIEALRAIEKVTGTARALAAGSADIGWLGIQGSLLAATHPFTYAKAAVKSLEAVAVPAKRDEYVRNNLNDILDFLKVGGDLGSSEFFTAIDRTGMLSSVTNWLTVKEGKVPKFMPGGGTKVAPRGSRVAKMTELWGRDVRPLGRLGTGFNTYIDIAKIEMWKSFNPSIQAGLVTQREIATYINNVMGTLNTQMLGVRQTQRQIEGGLLLFSPRFTRSAFAVVGQAMKALNGGAAGAGQIEGLATREAIRSISGMVAASTMVLGGVAAASGQLDDFKRNGLNPMKPGWLTVEIGGQRVGVGGSTRALLDTVFKSAAVMAELDGKRANDLMQWNIFDPMHRAKNPIPNFWLNRTAPGVREVLLGEVYGGQPLDTPKQYLLDGLAPKFLPFAAQGYLNPGEGNPHPGALALVPESIGLRARPLSVFERRAALRDELAQMSYGRRWEQLDVDERNQVESLDQPPLGGGKLAELNELVAAVESPTVGAYLNDQTAIRDMINEELFKVANAYKQHGNGATLREEHDRIVREAANSRTRLKESETHKDAIDYLEGKREARLEGETLFNQLYDQYTDEVKSVDNYVDNTTGIVDWDARDQAEQKWLKQLQDEFGKEEGQTLYTRMKNNYVGLNANGDPYDNVEDFVGQELFWDLRQARETLNEVRYWQQASDVIGDDPEMQMIWNQFEQSDPLTQEAMKREFRELTRIQRQVTRRRDRIRRNNPAVDKALMDFYGHRAANRENIRAERVELRRLRNGGLTQPPQG